MFVAFVNFTHLKNNLPPPKYLQIAERREEARSTTQRATPFAVEATFVATFAARTGMGHPNNYFVVPCPCGQAVIILGPIDRQHPSPMHADIMNELKPLLRIPHDNAPVVPA